VLPPLGELTPLGDFTGRLLAHRGALVERDHDSLVALVPPPLASKLEVAEYQRFGFDPRATVKDAIRVDYGSPLVDRFERIVRELGRAAVTRTVPLPLKPLDPEEAFTRGITVTNGVVRECRAEAAHARYVGFFVEHELLADERVSGLTEIWVNTTMPTAPRLTSLSRMLDRDDRWSEGDPGSPDNVAATLADAWNRGVARAKRAVENRLQDQIDSLIRRRDREFTRLHEYYEAIDGEIRRRVHRARAKGDDAAVGAETARLEATTRAYQARVSDLVDRYRTLVRLRPLGALVCTLPVQRVTARLHRRSASRPLAVAWNPIDRAIEPPCCDACGIGAAQVMLCDDRVHVLCVTCHGPCDMCGRSYCRACHARCPRRHESVTSDMPA
jgi:hypothetical protein